LHLATYSPAIFINEINSITQHQDNFLIFHPFEIHPRIAPIPKARLQKPIERILQRLKILAYYQTHSQKLLSFDFLICLSFPYAIPSNSLHLLSIVKAG